MFYNESDQWEVSQIGNPKVPNVLTMNFLRNWVIPLKNNGSVKT